MACLLLLLCQSAEFSNGISLCLYCVLSKGSGPLLVVVSVIVTAHNTHWCVRQQNAALIVMKDRSVYGWKKVLNVKF